MLPMESVHPLCHRPRTGHHRCSTGDSIGLERSRRGHLRAAFRASRSHRGHWPETARQAALTLTASAQEHSLIGQLLLDILLLYTKTNSERLFSQTMVESFNSWGDRPWAETMHGKPITGVWLAQKLRPYGIRPKTLRIGESRAKGYFYEDFKEVFGRYIPRSEAEAFVEEMRNVRKQPPDESASEPVG